MSRKIRHILQTHTSLYFLWNILDLRVSRKDGICYDLSFQWYNASVFSYNAVDDAQGYSMTGAANTSP